MYIVLTEKNYISWENTNFILTYTKKLEKLLFDITYISNKYFKKALENQYPDLTSSEVNLILNNSNPFKKNIKKVALSKYEILVRDDKNIIPENNKSLPSVIDLTNEIPDYEKLEKYLKDLNKDFLNYDNFYYNNFLEYLVGNIEENIKKYAGIQK